MKSRSNFILLNVLLLSTMNILVSKAFAQTENDQERARQEQERIIRQETLRLQKQQEEFLSPQKGAKGIDPKTFMPSSKLPPQEASCKEVNEIQLIDANLLDDKEKQEVVANHLNKCLTLKDIFNLQNEIVSLYVTKGYIAARAYPQTDDIKDKVLKVLIIEGVLESIEIRDNDKDSVSITNTLPGLVGKPLNLRDIEQGLDQINRLSSNNATMQVLPGKKVGGSVVAIDNDPAFPLSASLSYHNQGSESTGKWQSGLNLLIDNPLSINDLLLITLNRSYPYTTGKKNSTTNSIVYSIPFGYHSVSLGVSESDFANTLPNQAYELISRGDSYNYYIQYDIVPYRSTLHRWNITSKLTNKESNNYLNDIHLGVSSRKLTILDIDSSVTSNMWGGLLTWGVGYSKGLKLFGALDDADAVTDDESPRAQFNKYRVSLSYVAKLSESEGVSLNLSSQFSLQKSRSVLYSSEQFSIGGIYSVRGHVDNSLTADNGWTLRNELSFLRTVELFGNTVSLKPYWAFDYGSVKPYKGEGDTGLLSGTAIGVGINVGNLSIDGFIGMPLTFPDDFEREDPSAFINLTYSF